MSCTKLSSLKGKYVILDFWGSWCMPCLQGMPKLKQYREKYNGKLEIVSIAGESDDSAKWREIINKKKLDWYHILDNKDKEIVLKYNVAGFPMYLILDPNGKIIGCYGGGDDLYKKFDGLLNL